MHLVIIYGAPGVGKLTVAQALADRTAFKIFHNHLTVDLVCSMFDFGSEQALRLSDRFRLEMLEEAAMAGLPGVIFTFVYASGEDDAFVQQIIDILAAYKVRIHPLLLKCETDELLRRVSDASRSSFRKIRDPELLSQLLSGHELTTPMPHLPSLVIDNTHLSPDDVAEQIARELAT